MAGILYWLWPLGPDLSAAWAGIYPNIIAAVLCAVPAWMWAHRHIRKLHRRIDGVHAHIREATGSNPDDSADDRPSV